MDLALCRRGIKHYTKLHPDSNNNLWIIQYLSSAGFESTALIAAGGSGKVTS